MSITRESITFENSGEMFPAFQGGNSKYLYCNDFELNGESQELLELYNRGKEDDDYFEVTEEDVILLTVYMDIKGNFVADISSEYDSRELKLNEEEKAILSEAVKENYMNEHGKDISGLTEDFYKEMEQDYFRDNVKIADEDFGRYVHKIAEQFGIGENMETELSVSLKEKIEDPDNPLTAYDLVSSYENANIPWDEYATFKNVTETLYEEVYDFYKENNKEVFKEVEENLGFDNFEGIDLDTDVPF